MSRGFDELFESAFGTASDQYSRSPIIICICIVKTDPVDALNVRRETRVVVDDAANRPTKRSGPDN